jgi:molybdopterin/thiamine biosynthesis adenylyltransferase/rhodanese-related sulfurtransferase
MLSRAELERYQRHLSLAGFGPARQEKLKEATVLVIGAGGLGCPALLYLAAAGVGRIVVIDSDTVEASNLQRQVLFTTADVGRPKAEAAVERLRALNPLIDFDSRVERFTRANAIELVAACDVVVDGSDNFGTRYLVNDACVLAGKPFVYGAVQAFEGQVSVFNWEGGPTYRCLFPEPPAPGTVPNCAEGGVLGVMPGLIGTAQAAEAIKLLSGIGEPLSGRLLLWDALAMTSQVVNLPADPGGLEITELPPDGYGSVCEMDSPHTPHYEAEIPPEVEVDWLRARLEQAQAAGTPLQLVDCRETWEREMGAILPSVHIPLGQFESGAAAETLAQLKPDQPLVIYCAGGVRSLKAADLAKKKFGFKAPTSLRGGFSRWAKSR